MFRTALKKGVNAVFGHLEVLRGITISSRERPIVWEAEQLGTIQALELVPPEGEGTPIRIDYNAEWSNLNVRNQETGEVMMQLDVESGDLIITGEITQNGDP